MTAVFGFLGEKVLDQAERRLLAQWPEHVEEAARPKGRASGPEHVERRLRAYAAYERKVG